MAILDPFFRLGFDLHAFRRASVSIPVYIRKYVAATIILILLSHLTQFFSFFIRSIYIKNSIVLAFSRKNASLNLKHKTTSFRFYIRGVKK